MLNSLVIRDIVLIDSLELRLASGLCVLTGETGAGKSILLDALGLATGARGERGLVRHGATQGVVTAEFELAPEHAAWDVLTEQGLVANPDEGVLILRRLVTEDGRSKAFINDQPVSINLLSRIGDMLVEVHGQHDDRGLFNPVGHRQLLDSFGGLGVDVRAVRAAWEARERIRGFLDEERQRYEAVRTDEAYIRHNLEELKQLGPEPGEEAALAEKRALMMQGEKISDQMSDLLASLNADGGVDATLRGALRRVERLAEKLGDRAEAAMGALERAALEASDAIAQLEDLVQRLEFDPHVLEAAEERLFALRAAARKHQVQPEQLPAVMAEFEAKLQALDRGQDELVRLQEEEKRLSAEFEGLAAKLSARRKAAGLELDRLVNAELASLRLEKAKFRSNIGALAAVQWGAEGGDRVEFEVSTNPGAPFGSLMKIASGGELSRFILALKVVLARQGTAPTLVFDEVDRGIGGAVADAVGERLARLALEAQVLVVTHSPQVAAVGNHHWQIMKVTEALLGPEHVVTRVVALSEQARREEIARMLAGATVTDEARAAADRLMQRQSL